MRYFLEIAYNGTRFCGWQKQPNAMSVQAKIEDALFMILRKPIETLGCGRTDTGVHSSQYFLHFNFEEDISPDFVQRLNKLTGKDIAVRRYFKVPRNSNARFDAELRKYIYYISAEKDPFRKETVWHLPQFEKLDTDKMQAVAGLIKKHNAFEPFCKTNNDALTMQCLIFESQWIFTKDGAEYHISANRFLRGMVRLIVGACVNAGLGQINIEEVATALENQTPLRKSYSVPPEGLFLTEVHYNEALKMK